MDDLFSEGLFGNDANSSFMQSLADLTQVDGPGSNNFFRYTQSEQTPTTCHVAAMSNPSTSWSVPTLGSRAHSQDRVNNLCDPFSDQPLDQSLLGLTQDFTSYRSPSRTTPTTSASGMLTSVSVADFTDLSPGRTGPASSIGSPAAAAATPGLLASASSPEGSQAPGSSTVFGGSCVNGTGQDRHGPHRVQKAGGAASPGSHSPCASDEYKMSQEYRMKRERNNAAVRKSRIKAKQKSKETEEEVSDLRQENLELKRSLDALRGQLETLRALQPDLFDEDDGQ
ncbi:CCAAT/enhancer-binding protein beta-like [Sycon ciliatum]|uniref:CCAAT/enhancer-binding protein beta-like n=1 Tax=Sycon ciliatum TaxID=27933 RepID=UPI0020AED242|eukprot:scpid59255/ scgid31205/ CCAAT/enhancer-binding protein alpha